MTTMQIGELHGDVTEELKDIKLEDITLEPHQVLFSTLDHTGDRRYMWDVRDKDDVKEMEKAFNEARASKKIIYRINNDGEPGEVMQNFDKKAGKMVVVTQSAGG